MLLQPELEETGTHSSLSPISRWQTRGAIRYSKPMSTKDGYPLEEAVKAQGALRQAAGLEPERFPLEAFVGMISDEIEHLRDTGLSDEQIAAIVRANSRIQITAAELAQYYASPERRGRPAQVAPRGIFRNPASAK